MERYGMESQGWNPSGWTRRALLSTVAGSALGMYGLARGVLGRAANESKQLAEREARQPEAHRDA